MLAAGQWHSARRRVTSLHLDSLPDRQLLPAHHLTRRQGSLPPSTTNQYQLQASSTQAAEATVAKAAIDQ
jgi:hypothetical protein